MVAEVNPKPIVRAFSLSAANCPASVNGSVGPLSHPSDIRIMKRRLYSTLNGSAMVSISKYPKARPIPSAMGVLFQGAGALVTAALAATMEGVVMSCTPGICALLLGELACETRSGNTSMAKWPYGLEVGEVAKVFNKSSKSVVADFSQSQRELWPTVTAVPFGAEPMLAEPSRTSAISSLPVVAVSAMT